MISGADLRRAALVLALALSPAAARAERDIPARPWDMAALMAGLRQVTSGQARFVERKYLHLMTEPLQASGVLIYTAPDRLEKRTLAPLPSSMTIAGDTLVMERVGEPAQRISLRDVPQIEALVAGLRATLAGDLATLEHHYRLSLHGSATAWQLDLDPVDRTIVTAIRIGGHQATLSRVETLQADGDSTDMTITPDPP